MTDLTDLISLHQMWNQVQRRSMVLEAMHIDMVQSSDNIKRITLSKNMLTSEIFLDH